VGHDACSAGLRQVQPIACEFRGIRRGDRGDNSGKTMTIDAFIEDQAQHVNSINISVLGAFSGRLLDKLKEANAIEYPGLQEAVQVIIRFLESPAAQQAKDPLPRWMAETGFAAGYLLN